MNILKSETQFSSPGDQEDIDQLLQWMTSESERLDAKHPDLQCVLSEEGWIGVSMRFVPLEKDRAGEERVVCRLESEIGIDEAGLLRVSLVDLDNRETVYAKAEFHIADGDYALLSADIQVPEGEFYDELDMELAVAAESVLASVD